MVVPYIKSIQFFKERDIRDSDLPEIVECMTYEFHKAASEVFKYGKPIFAEFLLTISHSRLNGRQILHHPARLSKGLSSR